jgi:tetratricopeptide (TPR) repeat protein
MLPNDGWQMLTAPFLSKQEIARKNALAYVADGQDWERRTNYGEAINSFTEAILKDSDCTEAYRRRGNCFQMIDDSQKAVDDFNQVVRLDSQNAVAYLRRGWAYYNWRKIDPSKLKNAIEDFDQAIATAPDIESCYHFRAASYSYMGEEVKAIEDFTKVIDLNPSANSYYNRGAVYYQQKDYQLALNDFGQAINRDSQNISSYYSRGNSRYDLQDHLGAFQDYDQAKVLNSTGDVDPKDEHAFYARGIAGARLGDQAGAVKDLQTAENLCLENANAKLLHLVRVEIKKMASPQLMSDS